MKKLVLALSLGLTFALPSHAFTFDFDWGDLKKCTSGRPNTVANPRFALTDVPQGTKFIRFKLVDKDAPGYDHGGGIVAYTGQEAIEPGAFKYKSPCPPDGVHRYEWTATAQNRKSGGAITKASVVRTYP